MAGVLEAAGVLETYGSRLEEDGRLRTIMPPPRMLRFDTGNLTEALGAGAARNPVSDAF